MPASNRAGSWAAGFTLTELLVVIVIVGIILAFVLNAARDGIRRAEERATQTLISKLENGLNDRLQAILQATPDPNLAHLDLAAIYNPSLPTPNNSVAGPQRAAVLALYDYLKRELPDVFYIQNPDLTSNYPLNFAGNPFPTALGGDYNFVVPIGEAASPINPGYPTGSGIYGASYYAAAAIYKNLGYLPQGYDGVDNNANGLVDEVAEGVSSGVNRDQVLANLSAHRHKTARSEMLYALLVEGSGPLGSVFTRDEFTDKEVQDTDGDGLPEFVDAWGEPLQFYRWPILYNSTLQRGQVITNLTEQQQQLVLPYTYVWDEREQNPLDPNQQLLAPGWWYGSPPPGYPTLVVNSAFPLSFPGRAGSVRGSGGVVAFEFFFHRLTEPREIPPAMVGMAWDRSGSYRRAFNHKFLIVSSGPDKELGLFQYQDSDLRTLPNPALGLIFNENVAMPYVFDYTSAPFVPQASSVLDSSAGASYQVQQAGKDDISNHNLQVSVGGL